MYLRRQGHRLLSVRSFADHLEIRLLAQNGLNTFPKDCMIVTNKNCDLSANGHRVTFARLLQAGGPPRSWFRALLSVDPLGWIGYEACLSMFGPARAWLSGQRNDGVTAHRRRTQCRRLLFA